MPRQLTPVEDQLTAKVQLRLTESTDNRLKAIAKKRFRSKSSIIAEAVDLYLKSLDEKNDSILK